MRREFPGPTTQPTRSDILRRQVDESPDDLSRLDALLTLARYFADAADGVKGLAAAGEARSLALRLSDFAAVANALNSASISQYHRSDYVSAIATAIDAWEFAQRSGSTAEKVSGYISTGLALQALGVSDIAMKVIEKGLMLTRTSGPLREHRIRLIRLKAMLTAMTGTMDAATELFREAAQLAEHGTRMQFAASHGNWGIALLRRAHELLAESRLHIEKALAIAEEDGDALVVTDRMASLGMIALLEGRMEEAESQLGIALDRSRSLDYVRTAVFTSVSLGKLYLRRQDFASAVSVLRHAVALARRGAAEDILAWAQTLLAEALEQRGLVGEAAIQRSAADKLRDDNKLYRRIAAEDAARLAARILGDEIKLDIDQAALQPSF
jgi:tetratricopeptide (TPR) repeat protein